MNNNFKRYVCWTCSIVISLYAGMAQAGKPGSSSGGTTTSSKGGGSPNYNVTLTVADSENGYPLRVQSDTLGSYTATSSIQSELEYINNGYLGYDYLLTLYTLGSRGKVNTYGRNAYFDLSEPVSPSNPPAPFLNADVPSHFAVKCSVKGINMVTQIALNQTVQCPGDLRFYAPNGNWYRLSNNPADYPEVNAFNVTCTGTDSTGCNLWVVNPSGTNLTGTDPNFKSVNKLVQITSSGGFLADEGDYYIDFSFQIQR